MFRTAQLHGYVGVVISYLQIANAGTMIKYH